MPILSTVRVRLLVLLALSALALPHRLCAAFPLWAQNASGQFIVINTANGKYQAAPHQFPFGSPYSFTYDPALDRIWCLNQYTGDTVPPPYLGWLDPHTGEFSGGGPVPPNVWSLTYRHSDGGVYAFLRDLSNQDCVARLYPSFEIVCTIQPTQVLWNANYTFNNNPPINLVFDPKTDVCYYESSISGDGGVLFELDLRTGTSTVVVGMWDTAALTFDPMGHRLYGIAFNAQSGPNHTFWDATLPRHPDGTTSLQADIFANVIVPFQTSLAFVPKTAGH